jgi:hypothetical protein
MEPAKGMAAGGAWDHLPKEFLSLITIKVGKTSEDLLEDLRSLLLCNRAMKRETSSHAVTNLFNLDHHYQSKVWVSVDALNRYLQTVDLSQGVNNGGALFVKGMADICTG